MWTIRPARDEDALSLAALAEQTFRDAFAELNTASDMDLHCKRAYSPAIQAAEIRDPRTDVVVAEHDGVLVAFAQLRPRTSPSVAAHSPIELQRFYVRQEWHGRGLAQQLMAATMRVARDRGADVLWLGVWEHNPRAIAFYARQGFAEVGEQSFVLGSDPQRDLVMALALDAKGVGAAGAPTRRSR